MRNYRKVILQYAITTVAAGLVSLLALHLRDFWSATELVDKYKYLADAFTIPGVLLIMISALIWISSTGFFDGIAYAATRVGGMLIPFYKKGKEHQTYYDYKMSKKDKAPHGYSFLFFVGLAFMVVSIVFVVLFESVYVPMV